MGTHPLTEAEENKRELEQLRARQKATRERIEWWSTHGLGRPLNSILGDLLSTLVGH